MTATKDTTLTSKMRMNTENRMFCIKSSVNLNSNVNKKLEQKLGIVVRYRYIRTVEEYFRGLVDSKLVPHSNSFNIVNALLCQIEDGIKIPDARHRKLNISD